jgi:hypothetical protein
MPALRHAVYNSHNGTRKSIWDGLSSGTEQRRKDSGQPMNHSPLFSQSANEKNE